MWDSLVICLLIPAVTWEFCVGAGTELFPVPFSLVFLCRLLSFVSETRSLKKLLILSRSTWGRSPETK